MLPQTCILGLPAHAGMGSTSAWGWASQCQAFGGARACLIPSDPSFGSPSQTRGEGSGGVDSQRTDTGGTGDPSSAGMNESTGGERGRDGAAEAAVCRAVSGSRRRDLIQSSNFKIMVSWLSSSHAWTSTEQAIPVSSTGVVAPKKTLLEIALERQDRGSVVAFMTLMSLAPAVLAEANEAGGDTAETHDPVAFALRLYHARSTWRRVSRHPAPRRQGPGSRLHPNNPDLAVAVDDADDRERNRRSSAEYAAAMILLNAGLVNSLDGAAGGNASRRPGAGGFCDDVGGGSLGDPDPLIGMAPGEALTAAEVRSLMKVLGLSAGGGGRGGGEEAKGYGRRGSGGGGGSAAEGKDEVCRALEQWLARPEDDSKVKSRMARAAREAAGVVATGEGKETGGGSGILVVRLADDAREAIHRVHVAFFAAARHRPEDVPAILREDLDRVVFGGGGGGGGGGLVGSYQSNVPEEGGSMCSGGALEEGWRQPVPLVLRSVEVFAEFFRLVGHADAMELAACAGDSR